MPHLDRLGQYFLIGLEYFFCVVLTVMKIESGLAGPVLIEEKPGPVLLVLEQLEFETSLFFERARYQSE